MSKLKKRRLGRLDRLLSMITQGWRPYEGEATMAVYDGLNCPAPSKGRWLIRGEKLLCIGCGEACILACPKGFQLPLFSYPTAGPHSDFRLTPDQLLACRKLLNAEEAAYVLNVSSRTVRRWCAEGLMRVARKRPLRVPVEDVRTQLDNIGLWESEGEKELDQKALEMDL